MNRRKFVRNTLITAVGSSLILPGCSSAQESEKDYSTATGKDSIGVALVGLGYYSANLLAPALQLTKHCHLAGIVTGSPEKIPVWQEKYSIPDGNVYNYENMASIADNEAIDVVYIVLPNFLHKKYSIIGAEAGKHVWCEKPMAPTAAECQDIINACEKNNVKLSIGYRMQHEPITQELIKMASTLPFGEQTALSAAAGFNGSFPTDNWRMRKATGGGALYDMGVYSLNGVRYATGLEPISVVKAAHSTKRPEAFFEVDETTTFTLEFPGGLLAECATSFGENMNTLRVTTENGWYELDPFQAYNGISATSSDDYNFPATVPNQQAVQMDDDALAVLNNTDVLVPGIEGLRDVQIVEAIFKAAAEGGSVQL